MNKILKITYILLFALQFSGCATKSLIEYSDTEGTEYPLALDRFKWGMLNDGNTATLCFFEQENNEESLEETNNNYFTIFIDFKNEIQRNKEYRQRNKQRIVTNGIFSIGVIIDSDNIKHGCIKPTDGKNLTEYVTSFSRYDRTWKELINKNDDFSYFIPATRPTGKYRQSDRIQDDTKNRLLFSVNKSYPIALVLNNKPKKTNSKCFICYAGVPFTLAFDIITFPFQLIGYAALSEGM